MTGLVTRASPQTLRILALALALLATVLFFAIGYRIALWLTLHAIMVVASFRYPGEFGALAPIFGKPDEEHGFTLENYAIFFSDSIYLQIFVKSFGVAALTTLVCLVMAYPVALLIARSPKRHRDLMVLLCVLPFASNFLVRVVAVDAELFEDAEHGQQLRVA